MSDIIKVQPMREIVLWSQRDNSTVSITTDAMTWGQLKEQNAKELDFKNIRGVIRENKNILEVGDALLPETSCTIFLFPQKVRSGMKTKAEYEKSENRDSLRKICSERGIATKGSKAELAQRLAVDDKKNASSGHEVKKPIVHAPLHSKKGLTAPKTSTAIAKAIEPMQFATIETATISTSMVLKINDPEQLSELLERTFPGMTVVKLDATIDLKATLSLGINIDVGEEQPVVKKHIIEEIVEEAVIESKQADGKLVDEGTDSPDEKETNVADVVKNVKAEKKEESAIKEEEKKPAPIKFVAPSDKDLANEGNAMANMFK